MNTLPVLHLLQNIIERIASHLRRMYSLEKYESYLCADTFRFQYVLLQNLFANHGVAQSVANITESMVGGTTEHPAVEDRSFLECQRQVVSFLDAVGGDLGLRHIVPNAKSVAGQATIATCVDFKLFTCVSVK